MFSYCTGKQDKNANEVIDYFHCVVLISHFLMAAVKGNNTWLVFLPAAPLETGSISLLALAFITILLALAALLLLCHLLCFHIYLREFEASIIDF